MTACNTGQRQFHLPRRRAGHGGRVMTTGRVVVMVSVRMESTRLAVVGRVK
jgi:hypothetical protein